MTYLCGAPLNSKILDACWAIPDECFEPCGDKDDGEVAEFGPGFGQYRPDGARGWEPWAIHVLEVSGGRISGFHNFVDPAFFTAFGLPSRLEA